MKINFKTKVHNLRVYNGKNYTPQSHLIHFESDRGRIINSAAIRRLQQKTQVFPLERNAAVRSRLTHSLEVQQVGRYITQTIFKKLPKALKKEYQLDILERQIESIVEMSCLMHDIGNPPFGHFGEQAINDWFSRHLERIASVQGLTLPTAIHTELCNFEGNAQGIRLVHSLLSLNLTYSQVAGILKYTRRGDMKKSECPTEFNYLTKKVGYYLSEYRYIEDLKLALELNDYCRSPFSYIMEAADDISYCIADLEDAVEKDIMTLDQLKDALRSEFEKIQSNNSLLEDKINSATRSSKRAGICDVSHFFIMLRVSLNTDLVNHASEQFINNIESIYAGSFNRALIEDNSPQHAIIQTLKNVAFKYAFSSNEVEKRELQGYKILTGLFDAYSPLLTLSRQQFENIDSAPLFERRLYKKLPHKHLRAYQTAINELNNKRTEKPFLPPELSLEKGFTPDIWEFYFRIRLIQDSVSGMTDQFSLDEYRSFNVLD